MENMMNSVIRMIAAGANGVTAFLSLAIKNPVFLGFIGIMLLSAGKSLKLGRIISAKG